MKANNPAFLTMILLFCLPIFAQATGSVDQKGKSAPQQTPAEKGPSGLKKEDDVVRISVTLVQVDAVVTDDKGRPVNDLKPEDFEIFEDNRRQHITNFSYFHTLDFDAHRTRT